MFFSVNLLHLLNLTSEGLDITKVLVDFGFDWFHFCLRHDHVEQHVTVWGLQHTLIFRFHLLHLCLQLLQGWPG